MKRENDIKTKVNEEEMSLMEKGENKNKVEKLTEDFLKNLSGINKKNANTNNKLINPIISFLATNVISYEFLDTLNDPTDPSSRLGNFAMAMGIGIVTTCLFSTVNLFYQRFSKSPSDAEMRTMLRNMNKKDLKEYIEIFADRVFDRFKSDLSSGIENKKRIEEIDKQTIENAIYQQIQKIISGPENKKDKEEENYLSGRVLTV